MSDDEVKVEESKGPGRPPHVPTPREREIVELLAGLQVPQTKIAKVLRITVPTLERHYREELDRGAAIVEANLMGSLMQLTQLKDGTGLKAIMFTLQCRFGWSAYAPPPMEDVTPSDDKLGKKERQQIEAQTGHENTEWAKLLN